MCEAFKTIKLLEETGQLLCDIGFGDDFLNTAQALVEEKKQTSWNSRKFKNFVHQKTLSTE